jgi:hypothetical protein
MDQAKSFFQELAQQTLSIPLGMIGAAILFISLFLVIGKHRFGLLGTYGLFFYLMFSYFRADMMQLLGKTSLGVYIFGFLGIFMALVAFVGLIRKEE